MPSSATEVTMSREQFFQRLECTVVCAPDRKLAAMAPAARPESVLEDCRAEQEAPLSAAMSGNGLGTPSSFVTRVLTLSLTNRTR